MGAVLPEIVEMDCAQLFYFHTPSNLGWEASPSCRSAERSDVLGLAVGRAAGGQKATMTVTIATVACSPRMHRLSSRRQAPGRAYGAHSNEKGRAFAYRALSRARPGRSGSLPLPSAPAPYAKARPFSFEYQMRQVGRIARPAPFDGLVGAKSGL